MVRKRFAHVHNDNKDGSVEGLSPRMTHQPKADIVIKEPWTSVGPCRLAKDLAAKRSTVRRVRWGIPKRRMIWAAPVPEEVGLMSCLSASVESA